MRARQIFGILFALLLSTTTFAKDKEDDGLHLQCSFIPMIEKGFLDNHIKYSQRDAVLQKRVVEQYIKHLDPSKVYLLQSDVDQIKKLMGNSFDKTKNRDCSFLDEAQKIVLDRIKERAEFAKGMLDDKYKFDDKVEIVFDPDHKEFPASKKEAEDFLRKYVHFQISNYLATDVKLAEAKTNVKKNWDRTVKRFSETKSDDIYSAYLDAFARSLDPHSSYFSVESNKDFKIDMGLTLEGIGASLSSQDGFTTIESLVPGGPAAKSGLLEPQDKIVAVDTHNAGKMENVIEMDLKDVVEKIRGPKGTKVRLTILRKEGSDKSKRFEVTLVRDQIKLEDGAASLLYIDKEIDGKKVKVGVIRLPSFYADPDKRISCAKDMKNLLAEARKNKVDGIVVDLSTNGGGSLEDAVKISGLFFQTGNVVKQSSRDSGEVTLKDDDPMVDWPGPLVLLTSRISASASEILSATLKDYKRAVIVGSDHTFGKGSVQTVAGVARGELGAIKVTIGMFFTPGGNSTQHRGVEADVQIPSPFNYDDIGEKSLDYSLPPAKIEPFISKDAYVTEGPSAWQQVKPEWIKTLQEKSKVRVDKSEDFKKIADDLKKGKSKVIKLSEVLKDSKDKDKKKKEKIAKTGTKEEKDKEYLKKADILEASNVLVDLIQIMDKKSAQTK